MAGNRSSEETRGNGASMGTEGDGQRRIDLLVFDLDCTLADTKFDLAMATNYALRRLKLQPLPESTIYGYIGNGVERIIERALTEEHIALKPEAMVLFREYYRDHLVDHTSLYPHVRDTLEHFSRKRKAVATNKTIDFTLRMLDALGIRHYFDMILGGDSTLQIKPNPEPLERILKELKVDPAFGAMVGDSVSDVLAGRRAGMITCALTYGLGAREDLVEAHPHYLLDDIQQLTQIFV